MLWIILRASLYVVCDDNSLISKSIILPLSVGIDGKKHVCIFTKKEWADKFLTVWASIVNVEASEFLKNIPEGYGLVINPNYDASMAISSDGIRNILRDFSL